MRSNFVTYYYYSQVPSTYEGESKACNVPISEQKGQQSALHPSEFSLVTTKFSLHQFLPRLVPWLCGSLVFKVHNSACNVNEALNMMMPKSGILRGPIVMLAPGHPMIASPWKLPHGGTGCSCHVQWEQGNLLNTFHHVPLKRRMLALPSLVETHVAESTSEPGIKY